MESPTVVEQKRWSVRTSVCLDGKNSLNHHG